jgi:predicted ATPase
VTNELEKVENISELKRENQQLAQPNILAIKGLAQFKNFPAVMTFGKLIENWHVSDFHISSARQIQTDGYAEHLSKEGENLALVTQFMYENHKDLFGKILKKLSERVPGIKMFAYLVLLYDPSPHPLLCVEEPENQLYPTLLNEIF